MPVILSPAAVTGIGSLPFKDSTQAVQFVCRHCAEVPFWPQLPRRHPAEAMVPQSLGARADWLEPRQDGCSFSVSPSRCDRFLQVVAGSPPGLDPASAAGFFAFEQALQSGLLPQAVAVKGQLTGPVTLAAHLYRGDRCFGEDLEIQKLLVEFIVHQAGWQIERLGRFGKPVVLFVDEPWLASAGLGSQSLARHAVALLAQCIQKIRARGAVVGLHCCAANPFELMLQASPDIYSFDAWLNFEGLFGSRAGQAVLGSGKTLALGLIPTRLDLREFGRERAIESLTRAFDRGVSSSPEILSELGAINTRLQDVIRNSMVTPTCGLGLQTEEATEACFLQAQELAQGLRALSDSLES